MVGRSRRWGLLCPLGVRRTRMACGIPAGAVRVLTSLTREEAAGFLRDLGEVTIMLQHSAVGEGTAEVAMDDETTRSTCAGDGTTLTPLREGGR